MDIKMCKYHLDRRGFKYDDWLTETEEECIRCVAGFYPDWVAPEGIDAIAAFESHIERLLNIKE